MTTPESRQCGFARVSAIRRVERLLIGLVLALASLTGIMPVKEGTLFFYLNHSFVDRWKRFGTGAKRHIGHTMINKIMLQVADEYGLCLGS
jgi:hypothetical protein